MLFSGKNWSSIFLHWYNLALFFLHLFVSLPFYKSSIFICYQGSCSIAKICIIEIHSANNDSSSVCACFFHMCLCACAFFSSQMNWEICKTRIKLHNTKVLCEVFVRVVGMCVSLSYAAVATQKWWYAIPWRIFQLFGESHSIVIAFISVF